MKKVRFVRRCTAVFLAAAFTLSLTGCGGKAEDAPSQPTSATIPEHQEALPSSGENLYQLLRGDDEGLYAICTTSEMNPSEGSLIYYIDYAAHQGLPLCSAPNCTHDSLDCTAFIPASQHSKEIINDIHILDEEHLFYVQRSSRSEHGSQLFAMNRDGTDRRMITELKTGIEEDQLAPIFSDGSSIYFAAYIHNNDNMQKALLRLPIDGGSAETLCTFDSNPEILGCASREIFIYSWDFSDDKNHFKSLDALNVDTGELRPIPTDWLQGNFVNRQIIFNGSRFVSFSFASKEEPFYWYDPASGEMGVLDVVWPEELCASQNASYLFQLDPFQEQSSAQFAEDKLLFWAFQDPAGESGLFRYAVDLNDGSVRMIPLQYLSNGKAIPVSIHALTPEGPLAEFELRFGHKLELVHGILSETPDLSSRYAVIPWQDFWLGNINFVEIAGDFVIE